MRGCCGIADSDAYAPGLLLQGWVWDDTSWYVHRLACSPTVVTCWLTLIALLGGVAACCLYPRINRFLSTPAQNMLCSMETWLACKSAILALAVHQRWQVLSSRWVGQKGVLKSTIHHEFDLSLVFHKWSVFNNEGRWNSINGRPLMYSWQLV